MTYWTIGVGTLWHDSAKSIYLEGSTISKKNMWKWKSCLRTITKIINSVLGKRCMLQGRARVSRRPERDRGLFTPRESMSCSWDWLGRQGGGRERSPKNESIQVHVGCHRWEERQHATKINTVRMHLLRKQEHPRNAQSRKGEKDNLQFWITCRKLHTCWSTQQCTTKGNRMVQNAR